jgi:signal transduction histidine kinase
MAILLIAGVLAVTSAALVAALFHARGRIRELNEQLAAATDAQRLKESQLVQRSQLDQVKDEFISTVSHELRTPLTSIRGALGLLSAGLMGNVDAKAQNLLRIAVTNTDRLIRLINDILDLERMESGRAPLHLRRCNLRDLAQQAIDTMTAMADAAHVLLELHLTAPPEAVFFDGDADRILQVLTNLLSNAIKFSPAPSIVQIRIEASVDAIQLRVTDQGRGIPTDKLDAIFDRFQQVEASDSRQKGGTGLGLAICRTIVQQHNGTIWAESNAQHQRGPGASLVMSLPRVSRRHDRGPERTLTVLSAPLHATVIVCDDDAGIRTVVGENLRQHGYNIL